MQSQQEKRIWEFNTENTYASRRIVMDKDSFQLIYEDSVPTAKFTVLCENDMWWRNNSALMEKNTAILQAVVQYNESSGEWEVSYTLMDNSISLSGNLTEIS